MRSRYWLPLLLACMVGCSGTGYRTATVSGKVTLNRAPLANAVVTFMPIGQKLSDSPGPTASGMTDAEGKYTLQIDPSNPGAVVGKHRVYISTLLGEEAERSDGGVKLPKDRVPKRYNVETELTCEVPSSGRNDANFDLTDP